MVQCSPLRLTASSLRTIKAVWNLYNDFPPGFLKQELTTAGLLKSVILSTGLNGHLTSEYFVAILALMYNCLDELASFSILL